MKGGKLGLSKDKKQNEKNRLLRYAISLAIDAKSYAGDNAAAKGLIPSDKYSIALEFEHVGFDLQKAKALLEKAGYKGGIDPATGKPLRLRFPTAKKRIQTDMIVKDLAALGIDVSVEFTDYNDFQNKMDTGEFEMFLWGWGADYPDPENFFIIFDSMDQSVFSYNTTKYKNSDFDKLYKSCFSTPLQSAERNKILKKMNAIISKDLPIIPLSHSKHIFYLSERVLHCPKQEQWQRQFKFYQLKK